MKKILLAVMLIVSLQQIVAQNLLSGKYNTEALRKLLISQSTWKPFPKIQERQEWAKANQETLKDNLAKAETYLNYSWPSIPATVSLLVERTGDREEYQNISFKKREVLLTLLFAEIYENKGRFTDQIINGIWSISEESFWGISAHLPRKKENAGLMDVSEPFVDLFAAETATLFSWVDYYLAEKLDKVSPQLRKRIYYEIENRVLAPLMTKKHGFMGGNEDGRRPNNWNPWICSNWLNTVLLIEKNEDKRAEAVHKILSVLDNFLNPYPLDGGCDEGPGYWGAAAASLYDNLSLLNLATNDAFKYTYQDQKIKNMAAFIYKAQISETYFINFADASPKPGMDAPMIYRFGKAINDENMMKFGAYYYKPGTKVSRFHIFRNFFELFLDEELRKVPKQLPLPKSVWLPETQVMLARDKAGSTKGLTIAAKGGHNDESHNHNDIGNFMVYVDGNPLLIDVGSGTYTRRTFSGDRYDIWFNSSDYHNTPTINGCVQSPGRAFKATDLNFTENKSKAVFALDIAKSYPKEAGLISWKRAITLNKGKNVEINDTYQLKAEGAFINHLMTCYPPEVKSPGLIIIKYEKDSVKKHFAIQYDASLLNANIEKVKLGIPEDKGVKRNWGDNIYRINLTLIKPSTTGSLNLMVKEVKL
ncbi:heparinase II/III domain-containing protein [Pedobacter glucosidilyticus]|uniref:heparinase II/III domain-containing protein n=1 Tax=Pedobacter glucosidilyticus TaxID=1122941 RepID=UPI000413DC1D|nr:heparinase II/III family protein [Pedobacter glucosidilyticus]